MCVPEGHRLLPSRHRTRGKHVQSQKQHSPARLQSGPLHMAASHGCKQPGKVLAHQDARTYRSLISCQIVCVCHSEDGMVSQNDHHMMAVQMQLSTSGAHLVCSVGYMTNMLLMVSDNH